MKREVKFSLVFRDMWQSAGKYVPRVDQLVKVAPAIIEMGCFARVETNGGGFEQVNLLFGENPNRAVREWTKPFHEAGIQTHMLDRALNGLRMSPVPADVRKLFYKVKKAQGTDITRTFCGLNDVRNIAPSITYAKEAGMISQCSLCITHSPIHTVEYYTNMALELIKLGADEICIKDMAGIGRPVSLGKIVANIKAAHPEIPIQYHSHAGPGFNMASILEVCEAGCDYIDVGMEPLSWGTGHADLLSVQAMLKAKTIYIVGVRSSASLAAFLNFYLRNMFDNVRLVGSTSTSEMFEQLLRVGPGDVVIGFSLPRYSSRTVKVMQYAHDTGATCIAITDKPDAPAGKVANHVLVAKSDMVSVVDSLVAPMSVVNALIVSLAQEQQTQMTKTFEDLENLWDEYDVYERVE